MPTRSLITDINDIPVGYSAGNPLFVQDVGSSGSPNIVTEQGLGTLATNQISVASTSTLIAAARATRNSIVIVNPSTVTVYVGVTGVTTSTGLPIQAGGFVVIPTTAAVYGVVATGTQTVGYGEVY